MKTSQLPAAPAVEPARLRTLARSLKVTVDDIGTMTLAAGVDALEETLAHSGKLELPLRFHIAPPGTRAVFIPEDVHRQLVRAGELAGLADPAGDLAAHLMAGAVYDPAELVAIAGDIAAHQGQEGEPEA